MKTQDLIEKIINKLISNFDIKKNEVLDEIQYDFLGFYLEETNKYILSKELVYDSFSNKETILCKSDLNKEFFLDHDSLKKNILKNMEFFRGKKENQMASIITFLYIGNNISDEVKESIKKFKFYKSFLFGIKGWVNVKIIYIDIKNEKIITNKMGRKDMVFFNSFFKNKGGKKK